MEKVQAKSEEEARDTINWLFTSRNEVDQVLGFLKHQLRLPYEATFTEVKNALIHVIQPKLVR